MEITEFYEFNEKRYSKPYEIMESDRKRINIFMDNIGSGQTVLDLGCWDGYIGDRIVKKGNIVDGVEISTTATVMARKKLRRVYRVSLTSSWASQIKTKYDIILAGEIIEHIYDTDKFLQNVRKVLKKNGTLILSTPNIASLGRRLMLLLGKSPNIETTTRSKDSGHIRYFTVNSLNSYLEKMVLTFSK